VRRVEHEQADEGVGVLLLPGEAHPHAETVDLVGPAHPVDVLGARLVRGLRAGEQVAQHLGVGVELDLEVEMLVGERYEDQAVGSEHGLGHLADPPTGGSPKPPV
jgi:hypothetical protein